MQIKAFQEFEKVGEICVGSMEVKTQDEINNFKEQYNNRPVTFKQYD